MRNEKANLPTPHPAKRVEPLMNQVNKCAESIMARMCSWLTLKLYIDTISKFFIRFFRRKLRLVIVYDYIVSSNF